MVTPVCHGPAAAGLIQRHRVVGVLAVKHCRVDATAAIGNVIAFASVEAVVTLGTDQFIGTHGSVDGVRLVGRGRGQRGNVRQTEDFVFHDVP